ncbi:transcriptional regulator ATRX [Girardinichthys multiradiatus]|uniref:transcriptional regulator ATRX n=1 Tax=Girardinichthys multiradiatus TaxID=208333 RepID=UPI001FACE319|nr:transcriptional regulator ATRX [Girardinichthys multiradiatus]
MPGQTDADIPETGAIFTFGKSSFADNVPSQFWLKNDHPVEICCGHQHTAIITENGRLLMFGGNTGGQLGLKIKPAANKPASVKALKSEKVKLVACGKDHTLVCTFQDCVYGAGRNQKGQLSLGHKNTKSFQLLRSFCELAPVKMLAAGSSTSAALTEDGRLFMWGDNSVGQIGLGDEVFAAAPRELKVGQAVMWVSCGHRHSAFVTVHGGLYTFGESANGRLGLQVEQLANHRIPQEVKGIMGSVTQVCCGGEHTVALTEEEVYTFGRGQYGQLGHGTFQFELHLPKPLEHFHNSCPKHIACGENHTAVITSQPAFSYHLCSPACIFDVAETLEFILLSDEANLSLSSTEAGLLYTFGDGRYGKLGLQEENFINQFSPTLCTRFLKYRVQLVSCGDHHTLVLAVPRPGAQSQDIVPEKDTTIADFFWESEDPESMLKYSLMDPATVVPLSALAARARHREKKNFVELFGELPQNHPRLNPGFLSTSWQTSTTIQNLKLFPRDAHTPPSAPKAATASLLLSPRSQSVSSRSAGVSSRLSSPRSQSSYTCQSRPSTAASSWSKSKKLPSPVSSSTSIANTKSSSPAHTKKALKSAACRAGKGENVLNDKPSDALPPNKSCSPNRPLIHVSDNNLNQERQQTEGEALMGQLIFQDVEDKVNHVDFFPYKENKTGGVQIAKEPEVHADQNSVQSSPKRLLRGSISRKEEVSSLKSRKKKAQVTSQNDQKINNSKTKPPDVKEDKMKVYNFKSTKHDKRSATTQQPVQKATTKVKKHYEKNQVTVPFFKKEVKVTPKRKKISSASDTTSPKLIVADNREISSLTSTENVSKDDAVIQNKSTDLRPAEVTPKKNKVESLVTCIQSTALAVKSQRPEITKLSQAETLSVKSTPVKAIKPKPDKHQSKHAKKPSAGSKNIKKGDKDGFIFAKNTTGGVKGRTSEKQNLLQKKKKNKDENTKVKQRYKTKRGTDNGVNMDSELKSKAEPRIKKTEASSLLASQREETSEISSGVVSSQSPKRTNGLSVSRAKSLQSSDRAAAETPAPEKEKREVEDLHERKQMWGEIVSDASSLFPAAGIAGAAISLLDEAMTYVEAFQADRDRGASTEPKTPLNAKQFTKQSAIMHPSFSSTTLHSDSEERDDSTQKDAQMSILSDLGDVAHEEEFNDPLEQEPPEKIRNKETSENEHGGEEESSEKDDDSKMIITNTGNEEHKEDNEELGSEVENNDEKGESCVGMGAAEETEPEEEDEEQNSDSEEGESEGSFQGEGEESNNSDTTDSESEEEESSMETGEEVTHSEVSEAAGEDESRSEEQSDEEGKREEDGEVSGDEEEKSSDGSEQEDSESEKEEEEDRDGSSTVVSDKSEEEEEPEEEEGEELRQSEEEQETGKDESGGEDDGDEDIQEEEEGELSTNDEEAEQEATEDEEEGEGEGESTEEENEEGKLGGRAKEEDEAIEEESNSEKEEKNTREDEENEESSSASEEEDSEDDHEEGEASEEKGKECEEQGEEDDEEEEDGKQEQDEHEEEEEGEEDDENNGEEQTEDDEEEEEEEEQEAEGEEEEENNGDEEQTEDEEEGEEKDGDEEQTEEDEEEEEEEDEGKEVEEKEVQKTKEKKKKKRENLTRPKREEPQSLTPAASSSVKQKEAPRPASRSKQRAAEKRPEDSQQFWNNVLPQYLDLQ